MWMNKDSDRVHCMGRLINLPIAFGTVQNYIFLISMWEELELERHGKTCFINWYTGWKDSFNNQTVSNSKNYGVN